eukprot:CAMPEP_0113961192 /NCGR_PEP_ID=MMETSP0011_2-20120614/5160_1 /TAXON_ID=101924 /ORGANISM="Rhodosorus marinus" /LENGTH=35 /DNA_ID=CAMNT_0000972781 /DNA_START=951 /DNA_END=1058 /DNA_ORIENTATION=+ /assembly_acc=CAM_ASM_000156
MGKDRAIPAGLNLNSSSGPGTSMSENIAAVTSATA